MSTRGRIGYELSDGSILSVYHHWDSYPTWLGKTLKEKYNTQEKVTELIDGGDMSVCWTDEGWNSDGNTVHNKKEFGPQYYSERGEDCPPRLDTMSEYLDKNFGEEYAYIFNNKSEWICYDMNCFDSEKSPELVAIPS